jgi:carboxyl-terminal processing protease
VADARALFDEVRKVLETKFVDPQTAAPEQLWTGALEGMLSRVDRESPMRVNVLLSPEKLAQLREGLAGQFSGVGMVLKKVDGVAFVSDVIAGGSAAAGGLKAGDRILSIDGEKVADLDVPAMVSRIRGKSGTEVRLLVQREADEWTANLTRATVKLDPVEVHMLEGNVAYLRLRSMSHTTLKRLDAELSALSSRSPAGLLLDVRGCPGGLLDVTVDVADRFLPKGDRIISLRRRNGDEQTYDGKVAAGYSGPLVVLMDHDTSSGAEVIAAALADNGRAVLVGEPTSGKWTVEDVVELSNGWGLKYSIAYFFSPKGHNWQGHGIPPDLPVESPPRRGGTYTTSTPDELAKDPLVQGARTVLKIRKQ